MVKTLLAGNGDEDTKWAQFKTASGQFQGGSISADQYFATCLELFGVKLALVFPEFVTLLPDIPKQHVLLTLYNSEAGKSKVHLALLAHDVTIFMKSLPFVPGHCQSCGYIDNIFACFSGDG